MAEPIIIELAGVPVGKGRARFVRATGRAYTPGKTRDYENNLRLTAQVCMIGRAPLEGPLSIAVQALFPVPASWSKKKREAALAGAIRPTVKPDADNLLKVLDACNEIVWRDDKQIVHASISKRYGERASYRVTVDELLADSASLRRMA